VVVVVIGFGVVVVDELYVVCRLVVVRCLCRVVDDEYYGVLVGDGEWVFGLVVFY